MSLLVEAGKGLAGEWVKRALAPASLFWLGGLVAWSSRSGVGFEDLWPGDTGGQLFVVVIALVLVAGSGALMEAFAPHWLRLAEGYWPGLLHPVRTWLVRRQVSRLDKRRRRWQELVAKEATQTLTPREVEEKIQLYVARSRLPARTVDFMPTSIGNLFRTAETYPTNRYGLDGVVCWPRLWLLMPIEQSDQIAAARAQIDQATQLWAWGLLFPIFGVANSWCVPIGLVTAWLRWRALYYRTLVFAELIGATFDLHRVALYDALRLARPTHPETEWERGLLVTRYLFRGEAEGLGPFVEQAKD